MHQDIILINDSHQRAFFPCIPFYRGETEPQMASGFTKVTKSGITELGFESGLSGTKARAPLSAFAGH